MSNFDPYTAYQNFKFVFVVHLKRKMFLINQNFILNKKWYKNISKTSKNPYPKPET